MPTRAETHGSSKPDNRPTASQRGYTGRWQRAARRFLARNPLCRQCESEGRTNAAGCVDHIVPHRGDYGLFWDKGNWQPLCKRCHDRKTARGE